MIVKFPQTTQEVRVATVVPEPAPEPSELLLQHIRSEYTEATLEKLFTQLEFLYPSQQGGVLEQVLDMTPAALCAWLKSIGELAFQLRTDVLSRGGATDR